MSSQTFFTKLDAEEKAKKLESLAFYKGKVTLWVKNQKEKFDSKIVGFSQIDLSLNTDLPVATFPSSSQLLCSFELNGVSYFAQVKHSPAVNNTLLLNFTTDLFKSERRANFRLITFPKYQIFAEFDVIVKDNSSNVIDLKPKASQTGLFKQYLNLVNESKEGGVSSFLRIQLQDISASGMGLHVGNLEKDYFKKDHVFENVRLQFKDESMTIPKVQVMYVVDFINKEKLPAYKIGLHFPNLSISLDDRLSKKINTLLKDLDPNTDFENFIK